MESHNSGDLSWFTPFYDPKSKDDSVKFPLAGISLDSLTNEQVAEHGRSAPVLYRLGRTQVVRLSRGLVLKFGEPICMQEVNATLCALRRTMVRTPKLHRYFFLPSEDRKDEMCGYMVMDYVNGNSLLSKWDGLDAEQRKNIMLQIGKIMSELRIVTFEQPGPIGGGLCRGYWFSHYGAGPFKDKEHFNSWLNQKLEASKRFHRAKKELRPFDHSSFVLVHQDINPDNIILDPDDQVWLIDWGNAGAYPSISEAAQIRQQSHFREFNDQLLPYIHNDAAEPEMEQLRGSVLGY